MRNILQLPHGSCLRADGAGWPHLAASQQIRSASMSCCQSLLPGGGILSPFHGGGGEKRNGKLHGNIPWGLRGNVPMRVCRKPCGSVAMLHSRRARLGSSHAVSSFLLLSRLLLLFQASINNNHAVEVFLKSGAELWPLLQAELWGLGEQVA